MDDFNYEPKKSHYDAGYIQVLRLQNCWNSCHRYFRKGNVTNLNSELDLIWLELEIDASPIEEEEMEQINDDLIEVEEEKDSLTKHKKQFRIMTKKWKLLKKVENHQGMGKRYYDETEDDLV